MSVTSKNSKPWSSSTKRFVLIGIVLLMALAVARFSHALAPLLVAVVIAYVLHMPVNWLARRAPRVPRKLIAVVMYIAFYAVLALIPVALTPILIQQVRGINLDLQRINSWLTNLAAQSIIFMDFSIDARDIITQATRSVADMLSSLAPGAIVVLFGIAEGVIWAVFIFVVGLYLLLDFDKMGDWFDSLIPEHSRYEATLLRREIGAMWNSFFVGQMILCTLMGVIVGGIMAILGIRTALILGLVAAVAELVPNIGHTVSAIVGFTVALLEGSSYLPISNLLFAVIVVLVYITIAQVDINFLIPRIIGRRVHLAPAVVIVGLIAGASIGGMLGLLLAAPTLSSLRVLGSYLYRRLLDIEPYVVVNSEPAEADRQAEGRIHQQKDYVPMLDGD